jgi:hypothetical protein
MPGVGNIAKHHERDPGYEAKSNPDIDASRTHLNYYLVDSRAGGRITDRINARIDAGLGRNTDGSKRGIRGNAVKVVDLFFGFSPGTDAPENHKAYFGKCLDFAAKKFGGRENIISAVVHMDEKTPHMHVLVVPLIEMAQTKGRKPARRLSVGAVMNGSVRMRQFQEDFYQDVSKHFGLKRGEITDKPRKHIETSSLKAMTARQELSVLEKQVGKLKREAAEWETKLNNIKPKPNDDFNIDTYIKGWKERRKKIMTHIDTWRSMARENSAEVVKWMDEFEEKLKEKIGLMQRDVELNYIEKYDAHKMVEDVENKYSELQTKHNELIVTYNNYTKILNGLNKKHPGIVNEFIRDSKQAEQAAKQVKQVEPDKPTKGMSLTD